MTHRTWLGALLALQAVLAHGQQVAATPSAVPPDAQATAGSFPQTRMVEGYKLLLHAPQIRSWPNFKTFESLVAFELTPPDGSAVRYGTASVTGFTEVDMAARLVHVRTPKIGEVTFAGGASPASSEVVRRVATRSSLDVPLDLFLAHLADGVLVTPAPPGFNSAPPTIVVRSRPTVLLFVNGDPVTSDVTGTGLQLVVNANWPLFQDASGRGTYYLLDRVTWLTSSRLDGGWVVATSLPAGFARLPATDEYSAVRNAVPLQASTGAAPDVLYVKQPAELVVTEGPPQLESIPGATGLQWVSNTESPLFKLDATWYFLAAGRWFATGNLDQGPWKLQTTLPAAFSAIPASHPRAYVRASVPGTVEARMAVLEASLPAQQQLQTGSPPPVEPSYAGEPKFEPIGQTGVARAANSGYDVLLYGSQYYFCYSGVWYAATAPVGPWASTANVPAAIYTIPPSSPAYAVTQVKVEETSSSSVTYSYLPGYAAGMFVAYGMVYYGTGWYYPPYIYGPIYYPYWGSYGHGSWYNPATGAFASRSVWYGPYGGYSYTQGYNPRTGRYGYVETAWDGDEWGSHGQTYNPRTGVSTDTSRYYNEDKDKSSMDRTVQRGDQSVQTERTTNWKEGTSETQRTTSGGGSSDVTRTVDDGTMTKDGTYTTGSGKTVDKTTVRGDGGSATSIEGSGGGQAVSVAGQGDGRTTVAQSGSGDLYAGHDGNVYKKTDDGWQHYDNGGWQPATSPSGRGNYGADRSQLDRDYSSRQMGSAQFQQRAGGFRGGGGRRR